MVPFGQKDKQHLSHRAGQPRATSVHQMAIQIKKHSERDGRFPARVDNPIRPRHGIVSPPDQCFKVIKPKTPSDTRKARDRNTVRFELRPERSVTVKLSKDLFPMTSERFKP